MNLKLKFKNQEFQTDAVNAVANLFKGQEQTNTTFSISNNAAQQSFLQNELGFGNKLLIDNETLKVNLHAIQKEHSLPLTEFETGKALPISIEMETGTGKTFVYTKTILELNARYGFTKFIIVVPSVAIREGVNKSFQVTKDYFKTQYDGINYRYFIYDSSKLNNIRTFATSNGIEIMIMNIDSFNKDSNVINDEQDKLNGEKPIRYIQDTNPIVIIDEPQSVDNTPTAQQAIANLNPLCVLRYSATHRNKQNLVYRLTPVDAYQMGLVKQICVISNSIINNANTPYISLKSVSVKGRQFSAKVEIDVMNDKGQISRKPFSIKPGDDLFVKSGHRALYNNYVVTGIDCTPGGECIEFSNSECLYLGKTMGEIDEQILKRAQIYHTIKTHLDKELRYFEKGIKVLSLFFIDEVKKYRMPDGTPGIYAQMFEECYNELMAKPKYADLKNRFNDVNKAHDGYFSQDKSGKIKDTKGNTQADDSTYNTIMKNKEWLLSFECPLRFIFSHSALKEGWDNPNVFQVCTLIEQKSVFTCRQKIGRGLRLCVNQDGDRIEDKNINILHVIANENFAEFADKLQREIEDETGIKFGVLEIGMLTGLTYEEEVRVERQITQETAMAAVEELKKSGVIDENGSVNKNVPVDTVDIISVPEPVKQEIIQTIKEAKPVTIATITSKTYTETKVEKVSVSYEEAVEIMKELKGTKVIDAKGKIKDTMKAELQAGTLDLSARWSKAKQRAVLQALNKADNKPVIHDASKDVAVKLKKKVIVSPEFLELWDKIKQKTTYRVQFDLDTLVENSIKELKNMPPVSTARLLSQTANVNIEKSGITHQVGASFTHDLTQNYEMLPDILRLISTKTLLKRSTINKIIQESGRMADFLKNPQEFYEKALEIIERNRHKLAIDGIKYIKLADEEYYVQEIFDSTELLANLDKNAVLVKNSVYDHIVYDSGVESEFATALDKDPDVKMFFKIPTRFKIETPIGTYNPDWAVYLEKNGEQKLYFVLETKGTDNLFQLREEERLKIHCGEEHFKALDGVGFSPTPVCKWQEFKQTV